MWYCGHAQTNVMNKTSRCKWMSCHCLTRRWFRHRLKHLTAGRITCSLNGAQEIFLQYLFHSSKCFSLIWVLFGHKVGSNPSPVPLKEDRDLIFGLHNFSVICYLVLNPQAEVCASSDTVDTMDFILLLRRRSV